MPKHNHCQTFILASTVICAMAAGQDRAQSVRSPSTSTAPLETMPDGRGVHGGEQGLLDISGQTPGKFDQVTILFHPSGGAYGRGSTEGGIAADCPPSISTHTDASFTGGQYILQAGLAEQESWAASYTIDPSKFPLRLDLAEMIFGTQNATVQTTTHWSFFVWEGTPATGTQIFSVSSDDTILPHIRCGPGTAGVNVQFLIDPSDPEQIYITNNGSATFSIGWRIDHHNNQTANPCVTAPPSASNCFPATDTSGLAASQQNWINAVNCGIFGCPSGWKTFAQWPTGCRPSGDWVMRATWTPVNCTGPATGACCVGTTCSLATAAGCQTLGGTYAGDNTTCAAVNCQSSALVPCCFASTGGCVNLSTANCTAAGGIAGSPGQSCATTVCFPTGACCLPNGSCVGPVSPAACAAQGGTFRGNATVCATQNCPLPTGAACFASGFCLVMTQADAASAGAVWKGAGTTCADTNGNGTADACEFRPGDINHDGVVNGFDLSALLAAWGTTNASADINHDGVCNGLDLTALLSNWG